MILAEILGIPSKYNKRCYSFETDDLLKRSSEWYEFHTFRSSQLRTSLQILVGHYEGLVNWRNWEIGGIYCRPVTLNQTTHSFLMR